MGEKYSPKVGDRVRVVYEGIVTGDSGNGNPGFAVEGVPFFESDKSFLSVEKIEPPVEFFKPGDVVRRRVSRYKPGLQYLIVDSGWVSFGGGWAGEDGVYIEDRGRRFTSDEYEKVNLG